MCDHFFEDNDTGKILELATSTAVFFGVDFALSSLVNVLSLIKFWKKLTLNICKLI